MCSFVAKTTFLRTCSLKETDSDEVILESDAFEFSIVKPTKVAESISSMQGTYGRILLSLDGYHSSHNVTQLRRHFRICLD